MVGVEVTEGQIHHPEQDLVIYLPGLPRDQYHSPRLNEHSQRQ